MDGGAARQQGGIARARVSAGGIVLALTGLGMVGYAVAFVVRNFTHLIELGLGPEHTGATREEIRDFSPELHDYISHVQVNLGAFIAAFGIVLVFVAWFGVRRGHRWAWWGVLIATGAWGALAIPIHHVYGLDDIAHIGPVYLALLGSIVGLALSHPFGRTRRA